MTDYPLMAEADIATMAAVLRKNCINYVRKDATADRPSTLYVTEFAFPYWISLDNDEKFVKLTTYVDTSDLVSDQEYIDIVNRLNEEFMMVQFYFDRELRRLSACYMMPALSGVTEAQFVVLARLFPAIFAEATASRNARGEFVPPQTSPCQLIVFNDNP